MRVVGVSFPSMYKSGTKKLEIILESNDLTSNGKKYSVTLTAMKYNNSNIDLVTTLAKEVKFGQVNFYNFYFVF